MSNPANTGLIKKIMDELVEKLLLREHEGRYEIKHDIVASKVHERRITESNNAMEAARIVFEMEKNKGILTPEHLAKIDPYINRLPFLESDRDRLVAYIAECRQKNNEQIEKERTLRQEAIDSRNEALKSAKDARLAAEKAREAEIDAIKSRDDAIQNRNRARIFSIVAIGAFIAALLFLGKERKQTVDLYAKNAIEQVEHGRYDSANQLLGKIHDIVHFPGVGWLFKPSNVDVESLEKRLLFHCSASRIKIDSDAIILSKDSSIALYPVQGEALGHKREANFFDISAVIFAANSNRIAMGRGDSLLEEYMIVPGSDRWLQLLASKAVYKPTADFDARGNLFYFTNDTIKSTNDSIRPIPVHETRSVSTRIDIPSGQASVNNHIEFIKDGVTSYPSDYLLYSTTQDACSYIVNTSSGTVKQLAPDIQNSYLDEKQYLYFVAKNNNLFGSLNVDNTSGYAVFKCDLNDKNSKAIRVGTISSTPDLQNYVLGNLLNRYTARAETNHSPDNKAQLKPVDGSRLVFSVNEKTDTIRAQKDEQIIGYEVMNDMLVYVLMDTTFLQTVVFKDFKGRYQELTVPRDWTFTDFKYKKFMAFKYRKQKPTTALAQLNRDETKEALILMNSEMSGPDYISKWFLTVQGK